MNKRLRIGITHGDINGINYEIIIKTFLDNRICELCAPILYGSSKVASHYKSLSNDYDNFSYSVISSPSEAKGKKLSIIECINEDNPKIDVGTSTPLAGSYAVASLNMAMKDLDAGELDAVVTLPINKSNVQSDQFDFVGHTEFFASNCGGATPLMFMVSPQLRVGLVSIHEPLVKVPSRVTAQTVLEKLRLMKQSLMRDYGIQAPKIAVLGLNPHAGDCGLLGKEEDEIIIPALESSRFEKILAFGPFAADGYFGSGAYAKYDATLAIYHDQGLVPFKLLCGMGGVNYTAGLSVIRTSPAHGVGYDIAGKNVANPASFRDAIYEAIDIYRHRNVYDEISANPLQTYSRDNWGHDASASDIADNQQSKY